MKGKKGKYIPKNPQKYIGDSTNIIYRSSWEYKMMHYLDNTEKILRWNSEDCQINYISQVDGRVHTYYIDFYLEYYDKEGKLRKVLAEVKPYKQYLEAIKGVEPYKNPKTYMRALITAQKNKDKWKQVLQVCKSKGLEFVVLTERNTGGAFL